MNPPAHNPTMLDVAQAAGVSRALVSIVMRDAPGASPATREHVKRIAAQLGYVPDARARALRTQDRPAIGVVFRVDQPFHTALLDSLYGAAEQAQRPVVLSAITAARGEQRALESLISNRCGAVIMLEPHLPPRLLREITRQLPLIAVATSLTDRGIDSVTSDDAMGMTQAINHLTELGHQRIWFAESPNSGGNPERRAAFLAETARMGEKAGTVVEGGDVEGAGAHVAKLFLNTQDRPTAVACFNDACAAGLQDVLVRAHVRVPQEVSIIGFDDAPLASLPYRELTTIAQDLATLGRTAVELAIKRSQQAAPDAVLRRIPTHLRTRGTTARSIPSTI